MGLSKSKTRETLVAYTFALPDIVLVLVFIMAPVGWSLYLSLTEYSILSAPTFIGLEHYRNLLSDEVFRIAFLNTVYFVAVVVPGIVLGALALALLVNRPLKGIAMFRLAFFSPVLISMVIVGLLWQWIYNPVYGLANAVMNAVGLPQQEWLGDPKLSLPSIMVTSIWRMAGYYMIIFLAGLKDIPPTQYEAARIDGANGWQMLARITIPLLRPAMFFVTVTAVIFSFKIFTQIYVMTSTPQSSGVNVGGPLNSTTVLGLYIYENAFIHYQMGYASAVAFVLFAVVLVISAGQYRWFGRRGIEY